MRILIDMQPLQSASSLRGIGRYSRSLVNALLRNSDNDEFILLINGMFLESSKSLQREYSNKHKNVEVRTWFAMQPVHGAFSEQNRMAAEAIRAAAISDSAPDVILILSLFEGYLDDCVAGSLAAPPTAVILYDLIPHIFSKQYLTTASQNLWYREKLQALTHADLLLSISETSARDASKYLELSANRIEVIGSDADSIFSAHQPKPGKLQQLGIEREFLLYTGNLDPRKNLKGLIKAFGALSIQVQGDHQLVIITKIDEKERQQLFSFAKSLSIQPGTILLPGYVDDGALVSLYTSCAAFVFPSWYEGFGLPVLEAMRCGAAVIGANTSSIPEIIGRADALFDPYSTEDMANCITRVLTDKHFRESLKKTGEAQSKLFSWEKTAQLALSAMRSLTQSCKNVGDRLQNDSNHPKPVLLCVIYSNRNASSGRVTSSELIHLLSDDYDILHFEVTLSSGEDAGLLENVSNLNCIVASISQQSCRFLHLIEDVNLDPIVFDLIRFFPGTIAVINDGSTVMEDSLLDQYGTKVVLEVLGYKAVQDLTHSGFVEGALKEPAREHAFYLTIANTSQGFIFLNSNAAKTMGESLHTEYSKWALESLKHSNKMTNLVILKRAEGSLIPIDDGNVTKSCVDVIETTHQRFGAPRQRLLQQLSALSPDHLRDANFAQAVADSLPNKFRLQQLLIDVTELNCRDSNTGIQRVVKGILGELLRNPPVGWKIEPVYFDPSVGRLRYARAFALKFLGLAVDGVEDRPVDYRSGDRFLGLDLSGHVAGEMQSALGRMAAVGVSITFVVYDLLPYLIPSKFPSGSQWFQSWLSIIAEQDQLICISRSVSMELKKFLVDNPPKHGWAPKVDWFHLGSDIESAPASHDISKIVSSHVQLDPSQFSFLMVGTIEPRKGHSFVLDAFDELWAKGCEISLTIVGKEGWNVAALIKRLKRHPENGHRLFVHHSIPDSELSRLYQESTCLIAASEGEGFGLPLIEASRYGLPILARDIPVFREVAGDFATYFDGSAPSQLVDAITQWVQDYTAGQVKGSVGMPILTWQESADMLLKCLSIER